jgi:PAS domain S-box-containing protein
MTTSPSRRSPQPPDWADANCHDVLEAAPDAMLVVNRAGEVVAANQQAQKLYGYGHEQLIGRVVESLIPARLRDRHRQHRENFFANPETKFMQVLDIFAERSDGSEIPVDVSLSRLPTGSETFAISAIRDATERRRLEHLKRAEAVLRENKESEERFRLAAQAGKMYAFEWDVATDVIVRSPEYVNLLGASEPRTLTHQQALKKIHPEDRAKLVAAVARHSPKNPTVDVTYRVQLPGKSPIWVKSSGRAFFDGEGRMLRVIGMVADVTDQKLAEESLRSSEERLRLAQQAAHMGAFEWNILTGVNTWTAELEAMYGLPPGGFGGTQTAFENLVHPDDRPEVIRLVQWSLNTGQLTRGEWRVIWPDGTVHWIAGRWRVFMDESGAAKRMIGVNLDVTELKLAEEKLREYERAVENSGEMIIVVDREYRYLIANRRYLKVRNLTREQVVGHFIPELLDEEVFRTVIKPKIDECLQGRVVRYEMKYDYPDLGQRHHVVSYVPIEGASGVDRVLCILEDITDRKRAEQALAEMTRKLIQAQEQERARIGRELHDDINQRLALLNVELEQLQDNPSEVRSRVQELRSQVTDISNDVQALSHDLHSSRLEYLGVVAGMKSWCKEFAERQKMEIDFRSDVSSILPLAVGLSLFRVLQEALHNAIKHSGVKRIEVQLREESGEIHLTVSDSGRGFDVEAVKQGKGLGLTSMRERVRLVNGTISVESKLLGGTTIHVRVPFKLEQEASTGGCIAELSKR